jgi:cell filamentation protein
VLRNKLGIKSKREMDRIEAVEQVRALEFLSGIYDREHRFTANDICDMHRTWLGRIYEWAGHYRQVNVSRGDFLFAPAAQIPRLMAELEKGPLGRYTPCLFSSENEISEALALVHTELVLIHPFREGNGRLARMLSILMAYQAGFPTLDFGGIKGRRRQEYFEAVQAGLRRDYSPMKKIFDKVLQKTLQKQGGEYADCSFRDI